MTTLADRLRRLMAQKGIKAADIARATGVQPGVLSRYIAGKVVPSAENLITISQYFSVTPDWLLNGSEASGTSQMVRGSNDDRDKIVEVQDTLIETLKRETERLLRENKELTSKKLGYEAQQESTDINLQIAEKDRQIAELVKNCDALAEEVTRLGEPNEAHKELVEVIDTQKAQMEKLMEYCEGLVGEVKKSKKVNKELVEAIDKQDSLVSAFIECARSESGSKLTPNWELSPLLDKTTKEYDSLREEIQRLKTKLGEL